MCELCELKAKADKLGQKMGLRITQLQQEIQDGRGEAAQEARQLAEAAFQELLDTVSEHAAKVDSVKPDDHGPQSLFDMIRGGGSSGGFSSLN